MDGSISRKAFACQICNKRYTRHAGLKNHTQYEHEQKTQKKYKCLYCAKSFRDISNKNRHQRVVHGGLKKYDCEICGEAFSFRWLLEGHKKEHHGVGEKKHCVCGKHFSYSSNFYAHQRVCTTLHPDKEKNIKCDTCGKKYKNKEYLKKHIKFVHNMNQKLVCELCGSCFTRPWSLTRHVNRKHKDN